MPIADGSDSATLLDRAASLRQTSGQVAQTPVSHWRPDHEPHRYRRTTPRGHSRRRIWRTFRRHGAGEFALRRHPRRPAQLPSVPAAALPGRHRRPVAGGHRLADPRHHARRAQRQRRSRQGLRHRRGTPRGAGGGPPHRIRPPHRRDRRPTRLFRPRRMGDICARPQDHRRRHLSAAPDPARLREGGGRDRSGRTRAAPELRRGRRRSDRGRDGRRHRGTRQARARLRFSFHRSAPGPHHPGGSGAAAAHPVRSVAVGGGAALARAARRRGPARRRRDPLRRMRGLPRQPR